MSLVHDKDLPAGMKKRQKLAHLIAKQSCEQVWNIAIDENEKIGLQITGNEALSYMGTILQDFAARWIALMDDIRKGDGRIVAREDMVKETINGILACIGARASFEEDHPLQDGIKRLDKE
jgi:hypothetical protein